MNQKHICLDEVVFFYRYSVPPTKLRHVLRGTRDRVRINRIVFSAYI